MIALYPKPEALRRLPGSGHAVIEASAGTGKTHTLEHVVVDLVLGGVPIESILAVTFTNAAAAELVGRIRGKVLELLALPAARDAASVSSETHWILDEPARDRLASALASFDAAPISTIHGFCQRILTELSFAHRRLFEQSLVDEHRAFSAALGEALRTDLARDPEPRAALRAWLATGDLARLEDQLLQAASEPALRRSPAVATPDNAALAAAVDLLLPRIEAHLARRKREAGLFDYRDMLTLVAESLDGPGGDALAGALRARFRIALIDEFQDTDEVQWRIMKRIFVDGGSPHRLFVIGDPKQAIYAFRGADVASYLRARREIGAADRARIALEVCYRATAGLLDAWNTFFDDAARPPFFDGAIRHETRLSCGVPDRRFLNPAGEALPPVVVFRIVTAEDKLWAFQVKAVLQERIVREIRTLLDRPHTVGEPALARTLRARDIFILTRTAREGHEVGDALRRAGLPHAHARLEGLFRSTEAEHLRDLLAAVDEPHDPTRRARAFITSFFDLGLADLAACRELPASHPLIERLLGWKALAEARDYERLFTDILDGSGIAARERAFGVGLRRLTNLRHLCDLMLAEATATRGTLRELRTVLAGWMDGTRPPPEEGRDVQRLEGDRDAVQIMTVHAAKGLEAEVVFLYGGTYERIDSKVRVYHEDDGTRVAVLGKPDAVKTRIDREVVEEHQRLGYVALTRARSRLYLPCLPRAVPTKKSQKRTEVLGSLSGYYKLVNTRLRDLLDAGGGDVERLFRVESLPFPAAAEIPAAAFAPASLAAWSPPPFEAPPPLPAELGEERLGPLTTSYTQLRSSRGRRPADPETDSGALFGPGELPAGAATGIFLHELLEEADLDALRDHDDLAAWTHDARVRALFDAALPRHDVATSLRDHAERLVWNALTTPLSLGATTLPGLRRARRLVREMEFHYPLPEPARKPAADRGFVHGFVDAVFEHEGLTYVIDWKSDVVPDATPVGLREHVDRNYRLQAEIYGLALVRLLEIASADSYDRRFGGILYAFVRNMGAGKAGVVFERPAWSDVLAWQESLAARRIER